MDAIAIFALVVFQVCKRYVLHAAAVTAVVSLITGLSGGSWFDAAKVCTLIAVVLAIAAGLVAVKLIRG